MLAVALEAEVDAYIAQAKGERDERGPVLVVRNGHARTRKVVTGAGAIEVESPRVNDRRMDEGTGERLRFKSSILPPYVRKSPKVAEVLPLLYLHGLSTKDFVPALEEFFGTSAGLSASVIAKLTASWAAEVAAFAKRELDPLSWTPKSGALAPGRESTCHEEPGIRPHVAFLKSHRANIMVRHANWLSPMYAVLVAHSLRGLW